MIGCGGVFVFADVETVGLEVNLRCWEGWEGVVDVFLLGRGGGRAAWKLDGTCTSKVRYCMVPMEPPHRHQPTATFPDRNTCRGIEIPLVKHAWHHFLQNCQQAGVVILQLKLHTGVDQTNVLIVTLHSSHKGLPATLSRARIGFV